jgi:hypothetical protein
MILMIPKIPKIPRILKILRHRTLRKIQAPLRQPGLPRRLILPYLLKI